MLVAIELLNKYLKNKLTTDEIVEALKKTEVEIEQIISSIEIDKKVIAAKVVDLKKHPNADRLHIATLDDGKKLLQIVCGAPNIAKNQIVALAVVGSKLPNGMEISAASLRGVQSEGMICSPAELGLSDDSSGILVLDHSTAAGKPLCDILKKHQQLDIKTQPSRWDHLSIVGLGREIATYNPKNSLILPDTDKLTYKDRDSINVKEKGKCQRFISARLKIQQDCKSPQWLVDNLEASGVRSINAIVDITNFVMLETGQPSHAYDAKKLSGQISIRYATPSEKITTLDNVERQLTKQDLIVADERGPVALAGVMGALRAEVDAQTDEIILEVAQFDKTEVRRAALRHGLRTEASSRFERSLPLPLQPWAFSRLIYLMQQVCEAEIIDGPFDQLYAWPWIQHIGLKVRQTEAVLGMKLDERQVSTGLQKLGFEVEHFSITKETRKHLGKPYKWGANFKQDGVAAFDCSYLVDYIYSLIGVYVGHTALAQFEHGQSVQANELRPGDVVFYEGLISKSATDHYYLRDENGGHVKQSLSSKKHVGHNGIYIGNNKVIMAAEYEYRSGKWSKRSKSGVIEVALSEFLNNPTYLGARRYVDSFNHILAITVPWWRTDIKLEEDVIEEVAKLVGYDNIPSRLPMIPATDTTSHNKLLELARLKENLVSRGLFEVMTYSFISKKAAKLNGENPVELLEIENPTSPEQQYLRSTLLASLLNAALTNQQYRAEFGMFEISKVYHKSKKAEQLPDQPWVLGAVIKGEQSLTQAKGVIDSVAAQFGLELTIVQGGNSAFLAENRQAGLKLAGRSVGFYGQIKPSLLQEIGFNGQASYVHIYLDEIITRPKKIATKPVPAWQYIVRDIAIELDLETTWQMVKTSLSGVNEKLVMSEFVSDYAAGDLKSKRRKSIAFRLWLDLGPNPSQADIESQLKLISSHLKADKNLGKPTIR